MRRLPPAGRCPAVAAILLWANWAAAVDPRPMVAPMPGSTAAREAAGAERKAAIDAAEDELGFVRVHVPAAAVRELPLGDVRYVPMTLADFDEAVAGTDASGLPHRRPVAARARYALVAGQDGELTGRLEFDLEAAAWLPSEMPLGEVAPGRCSIRTESGTGETVVVRCRTGGVAVRTTGPGTYRCELRIPTVATAGGILEIPLLPALVTSLELTLPSESRPLIVGPAAGAAVVEPPTAGTSAWRISRGPTGTVTTLPVCLRDGRSLPPPLTVWNAVSIIGRQAEVIARIQPATPWTPEPFELELRGGLRIAGAWPAGASDRGSPIAWTAKDGRVTIEPPPRLVGSAEAIEVRALAAVSLDAELVVPSFRPAAGRWAGCGTRLLVDPAIAVQRIEPEQCVVISPTIGRRWPLPEVPQPRPAAGIKPACFFLEHQSPSAEPRAVISERAASVDIARVTTVDISPGTVLGRAAVDIEVVAGRVFGITAAVAPGWFIDSVEPVDWTAAGAEESSPATTGRPLEWRVARSRRGSELRIGFAEAATPRRRAGLRIIGHRSGLSLGGEFSGDEIDMVRFPGEVAMLELQAGPTAVLEAARGRLGLEPLPERLAALGGPTAPRARVAAGERAADVRARLIRRRPPVEADVGIDLVARDGRLAETFRFTCRPVSGELDAVVVHFSEPTEAGLEWALGTPADGSLAAQLLAAGDTTQGDLRAERAVAESWLVELRPATAATVSFTAAQMVPLDTARPLPLAWVEAAARPGGTVLIRGEIDRPPRLVNRGMTEVPPAADADPDTIELAYGPPQDFRDGEAAAELLPQPATDAARGWVWRQETSCWCHAAGGVEWETTFEIENQGRTSATLALPEGMRIEGVSVDGRNVSAVAAGPESHGLTVPLPPARQRIEVIIRGSARREAVLGCWRVGDLVCGIDMPVLDRDARLLLPPELVPAIPLANDDDRDWAERLFLAGSRSPAATADRLGFRTLPLPAGMSGVRSPLMVRRRLITSLAIVAGFGAALGTFLAGRRSGAAALMVCGAAAVVTLWLAAPWDAVARGTFWGTLLGGWAAGRRWGPPRTTTLAIAAVAALAMPVPAAGEEPEPVRVYITGDHDGGTALVPEPLFRRLAAERANSSIRTLLAEVTAEPEEASWRLVLEVDSDRGGTMTLDQRDVGGRWGLPAEPPLGVAVTLDETRELATLTATAAGRHRIELAVTPARQRLGEVETFAVAMPPAPRGQVRLRVDEPAAAARWQCDRRSGGGPWLPVFPATDRGETFEVSGADEVRLVRPVDPRAGLLASVPAAVSFNDIDWLEDECRLTASFDVGGDDLIPRLFIVAADPALTAVAADGDASSVSPLGGGRHLVAITEPRPGQRRVVTVFRKPLADPVGVFDAPWAWLEGVANDVRTVRLRPAAGLEAAPELPPGASLVRPRIEDAAGTTAVWRNDAGAAGDVTAFRPRIAVRRKVRQPRVSESLNVAFGEESFTLALRSRIDAGDQPLWEIPVELPPAAVIDGITLTRQGGGADPAGERVDLVWSRAADDRILISVQRPEPGRYDLRFEAGLPVPPASRSQLPLARVLLAPHPLELSWSTVAGLPPPVVIPAAATEAAADAGIMIGPDDEGPHYELSAGPSVPADGQPVDAETAAKAPPDRSGVPLTVVELAIDETGRISGLVRVDLLPREPLVTLQLPPGMRLFDVRVDGRDARAEPQGGNAWQVRLHDVGWPRSLVVVVAGELAERLDGGGPILLEPPRLVGLPRGPVLWSIETPAGLAIRVSEPARSLTRESFLDRGRALRRGLDDAFSAAVRIAPASWRGRLAAFAASRQSGGGPEGERAWHAAWQGTAASEPGRTWIEAAEPGGVTIRGVSSGRDSTARRGLATAAILGCLVAGWLLAKRFPTSSRQLLPRLHRWWWIGCGILWLIVLEPAPPGWLMLAVGSWLAFAAPGNSPAARQSG